MRETRYNNSTVTIAIFFVFVTVVFIVYQFYDPTHSQLAPKCIIKTITGYNCPGCGCQRLLYQWAHGNFLAGLKYNYFFFIGLLYIFLLLFGKVSSIAHKIAVSRWTISSFVMLYFAWWIIRNILNI